MAIFLEYVVTLIYDDEVRSPNLRETTDKRLDHGDLYKVRSLRPSADDLSRRDTEVEYLGARLLGDLPAVDDYHRAEFILDAPPDDRGKHNGFPRSSRRHDDGSAVLRGRSLARQKEQDRDDDRMIEYCLLERAQDWDHIWTCLHDEPARIFLIE
jgi:hypothetical protein